MLDSLQAHRAELGPSNFHEDTYFDCPQFAELLQFRPTYQFGQFQPDLMKCNVEYNGKKKRWEYTKVPSKKQLEKMAKRDYQPFKPKWQIQLEFYRQAIKGIIESHGVFGMVKEELEGYDVKFYISDYVYVYETKNHDSRSYEVIARRWDAVDDGGLFHSVCFSKDYGVLSWIGAKQLKTSKSLGKNLLFRYELPEKDMFKDFKRSMSTRRSCCNVSAHHGVPVAALIGKGSLTPKHGPPSAFKLFNAIPDKSTVPKLESKTSLTSIKKYRKAVEDYKWNLAERQFKLNQITAECSTLPAFQHQAIHREGYVHGDLKPGNILFRYVKPGEGATGSPSGFHFVISDFGTVVKDGSRRKSLEGTPDFCAPECLRENVDVHASSDVWSVGTVWIRGRKREKRGARMDSNDPLAALQAGAREVLDGYPVAAGLVNVGVVATALSQPTFLPPALPPTQESERYAREIRILTTTNEGGLTNEEKSWRTMQLNAVAGQLPIDQSSVAGFSSLSIGGSAGKKLTESQKASGGVNGKGKGKARERGIEEDTPEYEGKNGNVGVESAVKRIRSDSGRSMSVASANTSARKEGLVDTIGTYVSDLFAEDDSYVEDTSSHALGAHPSSTGASTSQTYFSSRTTNDSLALLDALTLLKLEKFLVGIKAKGKGDELLEELEVSGVGRLLKILGRSWSEIEGETDVYWEAGMSKVREGADEDRGNKGKGAKKASPRKTKKNVTVGGKKGKGKKKDDSDDDEDDGSEEDYDLSAELATNSRSRSRSKSVAPRETSNGMDVDGEDVDEETWSSDALAQFNDHATGLHDALIAAQVALHLLTMSTLPKSLYSSDYIASVVKLLRHAGEALVYPLLEAPIGSPLEELMRLSSESNLVLSIVGGLASGLGLVAELMRMEAMPEEVVISTIYLFLSPFFHEASTATGRKGKARESGLEKGMKGVRIAALELVRSVLPRYPDQRPTVVEEVLSGLIRSEAGKKGKGGYPLRIGGSIHTTTALILNIVQIAPDGLQGAMQERIKSGLEDGTEGLVDVAMPDEEDEEDEEEEEDGAVRKMKKKRDPSAEALDAAIRSATEIVKQLLLRSCKAGKGASGSTESEYRAVFDNVIADLLTTLHLPEWPAAEVLLQVTSSMMIGTLKESKNSPEANALKGIALDHLGPIAARLRKDSIEIALAPEEVRVKTLQEILHIGDVKAFDGYFSSLKEILGHLNGTETAAEGASGFTAMLFARDLHQARQAAVARVEDNFTIPELTETKEGVQAKQLATRLGEAAVELWTSETVEEDVFGAPVEKDADRIDALSLQLSRSQGLAGLYSSIFAQVIEASESPAVTLRTKALRGISLVVAHDPELFLQADVREAIHHRVKDASPAVRDSALELVGKYVVTRPDLAAEYLPQIADRIVDTGLSVRRRVVKLLKALYGVVERDDLKVDICRRLVWRAYDEDEGIKDLAIDAIEELWFGSASTKTASREASPGVALLARVIMQVTGVHGERPPPVDVVLQTILAKYPVENNEVSTRLTRITEYLRAVTETLIGGLVEGTSQDAGVPCVKTVYVLNGADPSLLSPAMAALLLPFLKNSKDRDEQLISDHLLKIFRSTVTALPKGNSQFTRDLQATLLGMVNKPSPSASTSTIQEIVACLCAVIRGQTHDFVKLINVFKVCAQRLHLATTQLENEDTSANVKLGTVPMLCYLTSLTCEHGNFDLIRNQHPETKPSIDAITPKSVSDMVFNILLKLHSLPAAASLRSHVFTSLGFLFRAYPTFMLKPGSVAILDAVFESPKSQQRLYGFRILQDFLASQNRAETAVRNKRGKKDEGVDLRELVGNVEGVASAVSQRFLRHIVAASVSLDEALQRVAADILMTIARSGFGHPIEITPTLLALTTSPDPLLSSKALSAYMSLQQKHASILASRFVLTAKVMHDYVRAMAGEQQMHGYFGESESHFGRWFATLKEKRQHWQDFLKALARTFELEPGKACSETDVSVARFVAEALSTLDFKRIEEPMQVISILNSALAVSGLQVLHLIDETMEGGGGLLAGLPPSSPCKSNGGSPSKHRPDSPVASERSLTPLALSEEEVPSPDLARQSLISGLALLLRDHLKSLYSINDQKMSTFVIGKKTVQGDKPANRRANVEEALGADGYARLPLVFDPMESVESRITQRSAYIRMIQEDGTLNAMDELDGDDDA
ncbi:cohesin loading factor subunit SCC2 [Pseudohyphozyma bogoriensis]|nr:cohesin loading factor subunit SCC2 [Pseudohyphozyma bogoriensis]